MRVYLIDRNCQPAEIDLASAARRFITWLTGDANPVLGEAIQKWLRQPSDDGGLGALARSAWDLAMLRAEVTAAWQAHRPADRDAYPPHEFGHRSPARRACTRSRDPTPFTAHIAVHAAAHLLLGETARPVIDTRLVPDVRPIEALRDIQRLRNRSSHDGFVMADEDALTAVRRRRSRGARAPKSADRAGIRAWAREVGLQARNAAALAARSCASTRPLIRRLIEERGVG